MNQGKWSVPRSFRTTRASLVFTAIWLAGCQSSPKPLPEPEVASLHVARKIALVIGNTNYRELPNVTAALTDAYDVADVLRTLRFDAVELKNNLDASGMARTFEEFGKAIRKDDFAMVYYSGHGGQAGGESYLLPVDYSPPPADAQVEARGAYRLARVRDLVEGSGARARVIILDACRGALMTNSWPAEAGLRAIKGRKDGTLIAYSAPPESVAPFDLERHGFYTTELLSLLRSPDQDVSAMLEQLQLRVYRLTQGRQIPYLQGSLGAPLYLGFIPNPKAGGEERLSWASAVKADTSAGYENYLRQFPKGAFADVARMKLALKQKRPGLAPGDIKLNPSDGQEYAWIPSGNLMMHCAADDDLCRPSEKSPLHVTIPKGFRLGVTEATVGAWKRYRKATGAAALPTTDPDGRENLNEASDNDLMPAIGMTRDEARSFCKWIGGRLPREEEWEYAAKAGTSGDDPGWADAAWFAGNSGRRWLNSSEVKSLTPDIYDAQLYGNGDGPHVVAQKRPNAWGLYDVRGNLWEWAEPRTPNAELGLVRGGSWARTEADMSLSRRLLIDPGVQLHDIGFRCVWDDR